MRAALIVVEIVSIAWGALTFGAVYPWGYWPLTITLAGVGLLSLFATRGSFRSLGLWRIAAALAAIGVFIAAQLVPISAVTIAASNSARDHFLRRFDVLYGMTAPAASHALSINPATTRIALVCFIAFSLALLGTARLLSSFGAVPLVRGIVVFGLLLALFSLAQNLALTNQTGEGHLVMIYGFWPDPYVNKPFGPFINKNNYAGWMLMAIPLGVGYLAAALTKMQRTVRQNWRSRVLALSSRNGAEALLAAFAVFVMGVSVIFSLSRSGMIALTAMTLGVAVFAPATHVLKQERLTRVALAVVALMALVSWVGAGAIRDRFQDRADASMSGRFGAWKSAASVIRDFPVVGTGINTFGTAMLTYQIGDPMNYWEEAHNDYLQIAAEGGVVGAVLALLAIGLVIAAIRLRFSEESTSQPSLWIRVGAVAGLCAIAVQELVEFSLQIPANAALFAALIGLALHRSPSRIARS